MQERLKLLKQLLGISGDSKDAILEYELSTVEDMILNYCNIKEIPKRLENILIGMCADYHRASGYGDEEGAGPLKSVSEATLRSLTVRRIRYPRIRVWSF